MHCGNTPGTLVDRDGYVNDILSRTTRNGLSEAQFPLVDFG